MSTAPQPFQPPVPPFGNAPDLSAVPPELRNFPTWILWKADKLPVNPRTGNLADVTDPETWTTFAEALRRFDPIEHSGLGCVIARPFVGIDLDKCRNRETGHVQPWALEAIAALDSYTELSPSKCGFHVWVKVRRTAPAEGKRRGQIEIYPHSRYFTVTGDHVAGTPATVNERDLTAFIAKYFGDTASREPHAAQNAAGKDNSLSAKEWKLVCDIIQKLGRNATAESVRLEFFANASYREKWEKNRSYIDQTIRKALERIGVRAAPEVSPDDVLTDIAALAIPDMPETVLDGRLGECCTTGSMATLPRAYTWTALVTCAGTLVPPLQDIRTNLFAGLVGETHSGKSVSIGYAAEVLKPVSIDGGGDLFTHWSLDFTAIRYEVYPGSMETLTKNKLASSKGLPCLLDIDELGHLLAKSQIEGASFPFVLNSAFYKDRFTVLMAKGASAEVDCRLSLIGGLVEKSFGEAFGFQSTLGLLDRFIFGLCPTTHKLSWRPHEGKALSVAPCGIEINPDVWERRDAWMKAHPDWNPRILELALRVAAICAAFDRREGLRAKDLGPAEAFAEYQHRVRQLLKPNVGENTDAKCAAAILDWLDTHAKAGKWVSQRVLYRGINGYRYGPSSFQRVMSTLEMGEELETAKQGKMKLVRRK